MSDLNLKLPENYLLYASHFYRYKNHFRLIIAYNNLNEEVKNKYKLVFVGKFQNSNYVNEISSLIKEYKLDDNIIILPSQNFENLKILYKNCKLFIFPSLVENCPNILLEAMATGAPILTSNVNPMLEYCEDSAEYFNANDPISIKNKIQDLLEEDYKIQDMKLKSIKRANVYTWDKFIDNLSSYSNQLCELQ